MYELGDNLTSRCTHSTFLPCAPIGAGFRLLGVSFALSLHYCQQRLSLDCLCVSQIRYSARWEKVSGALRCLSLTLIPWRTMPSFTGAPTTCRHLWARAGVLGQEEQGLRGDQDRAERPEVQGCGHDRGTAPRHGSRLHGSHVFMGHTRSRTVGVGQLTTSLVVMPSRGSHSAGVLGAEGKIGSGADQPLAAPCSSSAAPHCLLRSWRC